MAEEEVAALALATCERQYTDYGRIVGALDSKAQSATTIAGILLGALLTISGRDRFLDAVRVLSLGLLVPLITSIVLLSIVIFVSLRAMYVRAFPRSIGVPDVTDIASSICALPESERAAFPIYNFQGDLLALWTTTLRDVHRVVAAKAQLLKVAQLFLQAAIVGVVLALLQVLLFAVS